MIGTIDKTPLLLFNVDSTLNNRAMRGDQFNKRMRISENDSPNQMYMKTSIDLTFPESVRKENKIYKNKLSTKKESQI